MQLFFPTTLLLLLLATRLSSSAPIPPPTTHISVVVLNCAQRPCLTSHFVSSGAKSQSLSPVINKVNVLPADTQPSSPSESSPHPTPSLGTLWTPSSNISPSRALAYDRPLSSNYLMSLTPKPKAAAVEVEVEVTEIEVKLTPTSANANTPPLPLHELEKQDLAHFWTTEHASRQHKDRQHRNHVHCHEGFIYMPGNIYVQSTQYISRRPDIMVVGIVLAFLVLVACVETTASIKEFFTKTFTCLSCTHSTDESLRKGEIFLEDNDSLTSTRKNEHLSVQSFSEKEDPTDNPSRQEQERL